MLLLCLVAFEDLEIYRSFKLKTFYSFKLIWKHSNFKGPLEMEAVCNHLPWIFFEKAMTRLFSCVIMVSLVSSSAVRKVEKHMLQLSCQDIDIRILKYRTRCFFAYCFFCVILPTSKKVVTESWGDKAYIWYLLPSEYFLSSIVKFTIVTCH